ncbi:MAG: hypothetical protein QOE45_2406 [Frankiaceae bacterium]|jgi:PKD repeat protein|nr:hypothetical protein [Frankiaceae bacterium]
MRRFSRSTLLGSILLAASGSLVALVSPGAPAAAGAGTPTFASYYAPSNLFNYDFAEEPSIGVNPNTGAVMYQSASSTYRVKFNDATVPATVTWANATPLNSITNIDPILATDDVTGRTFAGGLDGECSIMSYSDNDGSSWTPMTNTCVGAFDHESIGSGAWKGAAPLGSRYSRAVYYCAQTSLDMCATSYDGGLTFLPPVPVTGACGAQHGHIKVAPNGTAYLPNRRCGNKVGGGVSTNNGLTWTSYTIPQSNAPARGFDPSVATTPDSTVYEAWADSNNHPMVARMLPTGTTWDRVVDLSNTVSPPIVASTFQSAVAGDNGRLAVAFLGTTTGTGVPFDNGYHGIWNLYVSYSYDGGVNWTTVKASSDPVQRGCIWDLGGNNVCRNLLDFMGASLTPDGRVVVGYADGCVGTCAGGSGTEAQSTAMMAVISRQSTGKGLYAAFDGPSPTPGAPTLTATGGNGQVALSWTTPANTGTAITGYNVYRGTSSGGETLLTSVGVQNAYTDAAVTNGTTYYYKVAAVNAAGTGTMSNESSALPVASNVAPTACFTHSEAALATSVNASCSSDPDGPIAAYAWSWGDGSPAGSGVTASHTYAATGTYTVTLTVTDPSSATGTTNASVSVDANGDPDPSAPTLANGVSSNGTAPGTIGSWQYFKVLVPAGTARLTVDLAAVPACFASCRPDLNLSVNAGVRATAPRLECPSTGGSTETCTVAAPSAGYWYIGIGASSTGSAQPYTITASYT